MEGPTAGRLAIVSLLLGTQCPALQAADVKIPVRHIDLREYEKQVAKAYGAKYASKVRKLLEIWGDPTRRRERTNKGRPPVLELDVLKYVDEGDRIVLRPIKIRRPGESSAAEPDRLRSSVDLFKTAWQCDKAICLYLWNLDSTGKVYPIFPRKAVPSVPQVRAQERYYAPADREMWFHLDDNVGVEFLFFMACEQPIAEMPDLFDYFRFKLPSLRPPPDFVPPAPPKDVGLGMRGFEMKEKKEERPIWDEGGKKFLYRPTPLVFTEREIAGVVWFEHVASAGR